MIYKSHDLPKPKFVMSVETFLKKKKNIKNHWIVGDFNIDLLNLNNLSLEFLNYLFEKDIRHV